jgi:predicted nucleic acid-binding protein
MSEADYTYYLDTSALVKRYVSEPGSEVVDEIFKDAYRGAKLISFSYWNVAEASVVFDKYGRRLGLNARTLVKMMLREARTLGRLRRLTIIGITPSAIRESIKLVLNHHLYVADALQIVSAKRISNPILVTADSELARVAGLEGLKVLLIKA